MPCFIADLADAESVGRALDEVIAARGPMHHVVFLQRYRGDGDRWIGEIDVSLDRFANAGERPIVVIGSFLGRFVV